MNYIIQSFHPLMMAVAIMYLVASGAHFCDHYLNSHNRFRNSLKSRVKNQSKRNLVVFLYGPAAWAIIVLCLLFDILILLYEDAWKPLHKKFTMYVTDEREE